MTRSEFEETRAVARLPHLDIEILHRRPWEGEGEQLMVSLRATPSFEALGRMLEAGNPMLFWSGVMQAAWAPWLGAMEAATAGFQALLRPREG
jgi:hypothetical protein